MAFEIDAVIAEALQSQDAEESLDNSIAGLNQEFLAREIRKRRAEIESEASETISALNADEKAADAIRARLSALRDQGTVVVGCMSIMLGLAGIIGAFAGLSYYFSWDSSAWFASAAMAARTFSLAGLAIWLVGGLLVVLVAWSMWVPVRRRRLITTSGYEQELRDTLARVADGERRAREAVHKAVVANIFELVNAADAPFYSANLHVAGTQAKLSPGGRLTFGSGLAEVPGTANEAPTTARADILDQIRQMPGGSVGISGPRGVGKSTLLSSICSQNPIIDGKPALAILTAAPVQYGGRDFLLHLHASLCRQVLKTEGEPDDKERDDAWREGQDWQAKAARRRLRTIGSRLSTIGGIVMLIGLFLSIIVLAPAAQPDTANGSVATNGTQTAPISPPSDRGLFGKAAETIGFKPGPLILFGIVAMVIGLVLGGRLDLLSWLRGVLVPSGQDRFDRDRLPDFLLDDEERARRSRDTLIRLSLDQLRNIRFQRSYTTGWAGGLKMPAGLELSAEQAMSLAQVPDSLPELVDRYRSYVEVLVRHYGKVIIGIDELDKLKSASDAETFLNEIKAVFNIPGCYYLVSVSEHALASFERRGIGFRDVFDSAFDDVHHLNYLDLSGSRALLVRRVINLPDPFLRLCHMISGGLPRDLIRIARAMLDIAAEPDSEGQFVPGLRPIASALIGREIASKIRATSSLVRADPAEQKASALIAAIESIQPGQTYAELRKAAEILQNPSVALPGPNDSPMLFSRQMELSVYLSFLAAVGLVAERMSTRAGWEKLAGYEMADMLARVRQGLETSVTLAKARLDIPFTVLDKPVARAPRRRPSPLPAGSG